MEDATATGQSGTDPDEAALLARMRAGDESAFEACVRTYCGRLLVVAQRILRAVQRDRAVAPITPEAHALYVLTHAAPPLARWAGRKLAQTAR